MNFIHVLNPKRAPPVVVSVIAVASVVFVSVVCDQVDQVVPAHRVDDIDEAHQIDPVHQVDHKDEFHFHINFYKDISLYKGQKVDRLGVQKLHFPTFFQKSRGHF